MLLQLSRVKACPPLRTRSGEMPCVIAAPQRQSVSTFQNVQRENALVLLQLPNSQKLTGGYLLLQGDVGAAGTRSKNIHPSDHAAGELLLLLRLPMVKTYRPLRTRSRAWLFILVESVPVNLVFSSRDT